MFRYPAKVLPNRRDRLPREAVRDLLGITRALYRAELALPLPRADKLGADKLGADKLGADKLRTAQLTEIGRMYRTALDLSRGEPDTMGHRAAWSWAQKATAALCEFVGEELQLAPVLKAAAQKLGQR